jgi:hypothetical protein
MHATMPMLPIAPFDLGPFRVAADGILSPRVAGGRPAFTFHWRGRDFHAELRGRKLLISAAIAGLPFSAEDSASRPAVLAALQVARAAMQPGWQLSLPAGSRVQLEAEADLGRPPTAVRLITASTAFAWQVTPFLDLLQQAGAVLP